MPTDTELLTRIRKGDRSGFNELLVKYQVALYSFLILLNERDSEILRIFPQLFLEIIPSSRKRSVRNTFVPWLYHRAHSLSSRYRSRPITNPSPLEQKLEELPIQGREIIYLRLQVTFSWENITTIVEQPVPHIKIIFRDALLKAASQDIATRIPEGPCLQLHQVMTDFLEAELEANLRHTLQRHTFTCPFCHDRVNALQQIMLELGQSSPISPPVDVITKVVTEARQQMDNPVRWLRMIVATIGAFALLGGTGYFVYHQFLKKYVPAQVVPVGTEALHKNPGVVSIPILPTQPSPPSIPEPGTHDLASPNPFPPIVITPFQDQKNTPPTILGEIDKSHDSSATFALSQQEKKPTPPPTQPQPQANVPHPILPDPIVPPPALPLPTPIIQQAETLPVMLPQPPPAPEQPITALPMKQWNQPPPQVMTLKKNPTPHFENQVTPMLVCQLDPNNPVDRAIMDLLTSLGKKETNQAAVNLPETSTTMDLSNENDPTLDESDPDATLLFTISQEYLSQHRAQLAPLFQNQRTLAREAADIAQARSGTNSQGPQIDRLDPMDRPDAVSLEEFENLGSISPLEQVSQQGLHILRVTPNGEQQIELQVKESPTSEIESIRRQRLNACRVSTPQAR